MRYLNPVRVAKAGTVFVGGLAFSLSYSSLADLAGHNGVGHPWMLPLVLDGGVIVSTAAAFSLERHRGFALMLLLSSSALSVAGNVAHAAHRGPIAMVIAAIPALWLLAATHLTVLLVRQEAEPYQADTERTQVPVAVDGLPLAA